MAEQEPHISRTRARAGQSNHMVRYILPVSLALVIILFFIIVFAWR